MAPRGRLGADVHSRTALGPADLADERLAELVALQLGVPADVTVLESHAEVAAYDLEALTTAGRYRVTGEARCDGVDRPFAFYVKVVQSWARSPAFVFVPERLRELALADLPWGVEPAVYASDLRDRLPDGLTMPTAYAVVELDDDSAALWLELVDHDDGPWSSDDYVRAARLLGRLAAAPAVREVSGVGRAPEHVGGRVRRYAQGRVEHQVLPALRSDDVWSHPLIADAFDDELRRRLLTAAEGLPGLVDELERMPVLTMHGDGCSRNLLVRPEEPGLVLIDFGFFGRGPVGFDLGQLLMGEVQTGERPAACLSALEAACVPAYVEGLHDEGRVFGVDLVRRAHALQLLLFFGVSALPVEHLQGPPTPALRALARARAAAVSFVLDLVDTTA